jgi:transposase-like protein
MAVSKCSEETRLKVIEEYKNSKGNSVKSMAIKFGLSESTIHRIIDNYFKELRSSMGRK